MTPDTTIAQGMVFNAATVKELRKAYGQAVTDKLADFTFKGQLFYTKYARYLLEYLEHTIPGAAGDKEPAP